MTLGIDYAWTHPNPAAIKAAGYDFAVRYLSHDPSKDITADEVAALHAAGLAVLLVFETTANRAGMGATAGANDRIEAEQRAHALGYPAACPIFYAVDFDATPAQVAAYFAPLQGARGYPAGIYGGIRVVDGVPMPWRWQTAAWSGGKVSQRAHLYQRAVHTRPALPGVAPDAYDENVLLKPVPMWTPVGAQPHVVVTPPSPRPSKGHPPMGIAHLANGHECLVKLGDNGQYVVKHLSPPEADFWRACGVGQADVDPALATQLGVS